MTDNPKRLIDVLKNPAALWQLLREYFDLARLRRLPPIVDQEGLKDFLYTRASFVSQTSLYGYLRTRSGMRYPELFDDDEFVTSINIAKWQMWLACLSDLAVFTGGLLMKHPRANESTVASLIQETVNTILKETGVPEEAGDRFHINADHVRHRLAMCQWSTVTDNEQPFSHSPQALVEWAPVIDELKKLDEEIVVNSVRFRWQKVRQDLRTALNSDAVFENLANSTNSS